MAENKELKPCPFCGGEGKLYVFPDHIMTKYNVQCLGCGASGRYSNSKNDAVYAWNYRTSINIDILKMELRKYADLKCFVGETELANGILKAISFIKQEFENANRKDG